MFLIMWIMQHNKTSQDFQTPKMLIIYKKKKKLPSTFGMLNIFFHK